VYTEHHFSALLHTSSDLDSPCYQLSNASGMVPIQAHEQKLWPQKEQKNEIHIFSYFCLENLSKKNPYMAPPTEVGHPCPHKPDIDVILHGKRNFEPTVLGAHSTPGPNSSAQSLQSYKYNLC
jgi:hypothetical protein